MAASLREYPPTSLFRKDEPPHRILVTFYPPCAVGWRERGNPNSSGSSPLLRSSCSEAEVRLRGWGRDDGRLRIRTCQVPDKGEKTQPLHPSAHCSLLGPQRPAWSLEPFNAAVPWKGWGRCQHRKLIYQSGAAGAGTVTEGETEGRPQCRGVRNGAEIERRETEAENEPRAR